MTICYLKNKLLQKHINDKIKITITLMTEIKFTMQ